MTANFQGPLLQGRCEDLCLGWDYTIGFIDVFRSYERFSVLGEKTLKETALLLEEVDKNKATINEQNLLGMLIFTM